MTSGILQNYPVWYHTTSQMCGKEVTEIDKAEAELIKMDLKLENGGEMSPEEKMKDIKRYVAQYLERLDGLVYVNEIAEALKMDINLVITILRDLGLEVE